MEKRKQLSAPETLEQFYQHKFYELPANLAQDGNHFNVFRLEDVLKCTSEPSPYSRRDYYKITLISGTNRYHYADKTLEVAGTALAFFSSHVPYTWENVAGDPTGYFCVFKEGFFVENMRSNIRDLPMFAPGGKPFYMLNAEQEKNVEAIFEKMLTEMKSDYTYKFDLIRNYITEMVHNALKMEPSGMLYQHPDANSRITAVFTELLDRQFPIESPDQQFTMRSAKDYADKMAVHVNHLNRAIKLTTGKTTTEHIAERIANEAKALLKHTNWNVSEIGYALGFEEPSHFNNFFKKQVAVTPLAFRTA